LQRMVISFCDRLPLFSPFGRLSCFPPPPIPMAFFFPGFFPVRRAHFPGIFSFLLFTGASGAIQVLFSDLSEGVAGEGKSSLLFSPKGGGGGPYLGSLGVCERRGLFFFPAHTFTGFFGVPKAFFFENLVQIPCPFPPIKEPFFPPTVLLVRKGRSLNIHPFCGRPL